MQNIDIDINKDWTSYKDNDVAIINDVKKLLLRNIGGVIKTNMVMAVFCIKGKMQAKIEGVPYTINANEVMICSFNTVISDYMLSSDLEMFAIGVKPGFLDKNIYIDKKFWEYAEFVEQKHVMKLQDKEIELFMHYYRIGEAAMNKEEGKYKDIIINHLKKCFIYEFFDIIRSRMPNDFSASSDIRQEDLIFRKFLKLLNENDGRMHKVSDFADALFITPKYLSMLVKRVSGKSCLGWIHEFMIKEIQRELTYTNKTVSQISTDLGFPNVSFFSKFVRTHLGSSPTIIRNGHCSSSE